MEIKDTEMAKKNKDKYNSNITQEDKQMLQQDHIHGDGGDDQQLKERERPVDFTGSDLDVPGRTDAKKGNGPLGLNDEENKVHSQGSAHNSNLEHDRLP